MVECGVTSFIRGSALSQTPLYGSLHFTLLPVQVVSATRSLHSRRLIYLTACPSSSGEYQPAIDPIPCRGNVCYPVPHPTCAYSNPALAPLFVAVGAGVVGATGYVHSAFQLLVQGSHTDLGGSSLGSPLTTSVTTRTLSSISETRPNHG